MVRGAIPHRLYGLEAVSQPRVDLLSGRSQRQILLPAGPHGERPAFGLRIAGEIAGEKPVVVRALFFRAWGNPGEEMPPPRKSCACREVGPGAADVDADTPDFGEREVEAHAAARHRGRRCRLERLQ